MGKSNHRKREVKPRDGQICPSAMEDIRERLVNRIKQKGIPRNHLADMTGDSRDNVRNWVAEKDAVKKNAIPADFLVRFITAVPTSAEWLLAGRGDPEPHEPARAQQALTFVRSVLETMDRDPEGFAVMMNQWNEAAEKRPAAQTEEKSETLGKIVQRVPLDAAKLVNPLGRDRDHPESPEE